ncbi:TPA: ParA family protein [Acinetobacter baumannii]|nr:ParA family protein [Acinetobacter baumannii]EKU1104537.1 ParA family protein [Acinetobacter baumannii]EKU2524609.1 ParA family protein [Acinetobacter baumannii]EKU6499356.1 ParA family protein [Acinetobacter baumannii]EKU9362314.1 ParA family protein [Acinetobacter baumannii]
MIIVYANTKGGVSKTTLATSTVAALHQRGNTVIGIDLDANKGSFEWSQAREAENEVENGKFFHLTGNIEDEARRLNEEYDYVVIDTPGYDSAEMRSALLAADVIVSPLKVGAQDLKGLYTLLDLVDLINHTVRKPAGENPIVVHPVITQAPAADNSVDLRDTIKALEAIQNEAPRLQTIMRLRMPYSRAYRNNVGITEMEMDVNNRVAIKEFEQLLEEIIENGKR